MVYSSKCKKIVLETASCCWSPLLQGSLFPFISSPTWAGVGWGWGRQRVVEEPLAAFPGGQDARYRGALPPAKPQGLRSVAKGTATLTKAFDPRRNPSCPGRPLEPAVTGRPFQKGLLEGAGGGGNPWIGSLRGGWLPISGCGRRKDTRGRLGAERGGVLGWVRCPQEGGGPQGKGFRVSGTLPTLPARLAQIKGPAEGREVHGKTMFV